MRSNTSKGQILSIIIFIFRELTHQPKKYTEISQAEKNHMKHGISEQVMNICIHVDRKDYKEMEEEGSRCPPLLGFKVSFSTGHVKDDIYFDCNEAIRTKKG